MGQQPFLKSKLIIKNKLPSAEFIDKHGLYLPNHANLTIKDVDFICKHFQLSAKPIFFS